jgi:alpha-L-rhamnosidase
VQQQFVDPTREKGQFLGDTVSTSYATMATWMERDATQKAILEFASSQTRYWSDGRLNAVYPNGDGKRDIPDFTEMYPIWVWRYYLETGDKTLLARVYAVMQNVADYVWSYRDGTTGLVTNLAGGGGAYQFGIIEWPPSERRGYDVATTARTTVNILGAEVQRVTAAAAAALGRPASEVATYDTRTDQLTTAINSRLRRSDGVYIDGSNGDTASTHASQHANSYALAFGIVPAASRTAVIDHVVGMGMNQGPMTAHWLAKALGDSERYDALLDLLTDKGQPGWANILSQGATYTWESWDAAARGESESHAWAAQVAVDILEAMLGARVIAPGATLVGIRPPRTGLTFAKGEIETQRGPVKVSWMREGSTGMTLTIDVPMNVRAEVALPATDVDVTTATGAGAPRYRSTSGGWVIYDAGSGASVFTTR